MPVVSASRSIVVWFLIMIASLTIVYTQPTASGMPSPGSPPDGADTPDDDSDWPSVPIPPDEVGGTGAEDWEPVEGLQTGRLSVDSRIDVW
jgi:hypothetical protein